MRAHMSHCIVPFCREMEAVNPKMRGRKKGGRLLCQHRSSPLGRNETTDFIAPGRFPRGGGKNACGEGAFGSGSEESKAERLAKRYRENASGPNSLGSGS